MRADRLSTDGFASTPAHQGHVEVNLWLEMARVSVRRRWKPDRSVLSVVGLLPDRGRPDGFVWDAAPSARREGARSGQVRIPLLRVGSRAGSDVGWMDVPHVAQREDRPGVPS